MSLTIFPEIHNAVSALSSTLLCSSEFTQFLSFFTNRYQSKVRRESGNWRAISQYHYLSDGEILESLECNATLQRACSFDTETRFAAIKVTAGSTYSDSAGLATVTSALGAIASNAKLFRYNGDVYFYIFFTDAQISTEVSTALKSALSANDIEIAESAITVYPSVDSVLPLPLQGDFTWLNPCGQTVMGRQEISLYSALARFIFDSSKNAIDGAIFFEALSNAIVSVPEKTIGTDDDLDEQAIQFADNLSISFSENMRLDAAVAMPHLVRPKELHEISNRVWTHPRLLLSIKPILKIGCDETRLLSRAPPERLLRNKAYRCRSPASKRLSSCNAGHIWARKNSSCSITTMAREL